MPKITFGLSNLYYSKITESEAGAITYATPVRLPGAKEMSLSASGELTQIYADDVVYVTVDAAAGYDGDVTVLDVPEAFCTDILGMKKDKNGVLVENEDDTMSPFALLGEFKTETTTRKRFCLYNCSAAKPDFGGTTKEDSVEAQEFAIKLTASAASDTGAVKATCTNDTATATQFNAWFTQVYVPQNATGTGDKTSPLD